jgi:endo-1,4-beta-xylanase
LAETPTVQTLTRKNLLLGLGASIASGCSGGGAIVSAASTTSNSQAPKEPASVTQCATAGSAVRQKAIQAALRRSGTLACYAAEAGMLFGSLWEAGFGSNDTPPYIAAVESDCSSVVAAGLSDYVQEATANFSFPDEQLAVAERYNLASAGGYFVHGRYAPSWVTSSTSSQDALSQLARLVTLPMSHYVGMFDHYIVVNEAIAIGEGNANGIASSAWLSCIGPSYIAEAYSAARAADPTATLIYNDDELEEALSYSSSKRDAVLNLLSSLKSQGLIDGLGLEAHLSLANSFDSTSFTKFLDSVYSLGLKVYITELDVNDESAPADVSTRDSMVAERYTAFLTTALSHPGVSDINVWGLSDSYSWLQTVTPRPDGLPLRPCLLDSNFQPKPAYYAVLTALQTANTCSS